MFLHTVRFHSLRRRGSRYLILLCLGALAYGRIIPYFDRLTSALAQQVSNPAEKRKDASVVLELKRPIEREISGGEVHSYQIVLTAGQYCEVVVRQLGVDMVVALIGPDDKPVAEIDAEIRNQGEELVMQVAEMSGAYRLDVRPRQRTASAGRYEIQATELRAATERDKGLQEARNLFREALQLHRSDKYNEVQSLVEQVIEIRERLLGTEHPEVANAINLLADVYRLRGDYAKAESLHLRILTIRENRFGKDHPYVARSLMNLALVYTNSGNYSKAIPFFERGLAIIEKSLGADHPNLPRFLNNTAMAYRKKEDLGRAESFYQRAMEIGERVREVDRFDYADSLQGLASVASIRGDYLKAEQFYQRALAIYEKEQGPDSLNYARVLDDLSIVYHVKGDYEKAAAGHLRALQIREKMLGADDQNVAHTLNSLANVYLDKADYVKAEQLHQRALTIREKSFGKDHQFVAESLYNLGIIYRNTGDYAKAEQLNLRALEIFEKTLGPDHSNTAYPLGKLADIYKYQGNYAKAEPLYQRELSIFERALGPEHPSVGGTLNELAMFYAAKGDVGQALSYSLRANRVSERNIIFNLSTGSERQRFAYLKQLSYENNLTISLHTLFAPTDSAARRMAMTNVLQRKGRALEATTDSLTSLRRRAGPQDQRLLDEFIDARYQLAKLALSSPKNVSKDDHQSQVKAFAERVERLEADISSRSAEFRAQSQPVTFESIQESIPLNSGIIEFDVYRPFNAKHSKPDNAFGEPRYVAYFLRQSGEIQWADLGEAAPIDLAIDAWRKALRDPHRTDVKQLARAVDEKVMRPVRALLGETRQVLISPDGALNLIPFAALVDEQNHYLVERYSFSYLTSGRDLLRLQVPRESKSAPMIVASPDYGAVATTATKPDGGQQVDLSQVYFKPLAGTAGEARALKGLLPNATVLTGDQATEAAVKQANAPSILHIATHGFFLEAPDGSSEKAGKKSADQARESELRLSKLAANVENPLLRSGLALAGANQMKSGDDDGVLTALEASVLNLWGTKLVVLSACDTGVGEVKNGDGVYGLRRALVLAGSETQVMSLWPVSDTDTRDLMISYYTGLQAGQGRGEALRQVQLKMLKSKTRQHPHYWASFIQSGEWANLDGKR